MQVATLFNDANCIMVSCQVDFATVVLVGLFQHLTVVLPFALRSLPPAGSPRAGLVTFLWNPLDDQALPLHCQLPCNAYRHDGSLIALGRPV